MHNKTWPMVAYVIIPGEDAIARVDRGEMGYRPAPIPTSREQADAMNEAAGVTHAQRESMMVGSMFGWHVPGADPERAEKLYAKARPLAAE